MGSKKSSIAMFVLFVVITPCVNADEPASKWVKHDKAVMGPSRPIALVHAPGVQRWMALGYYATTSDRKPATYDELAFDPAEGQWENWFPKGKDWGSKFGACKPPQWKESKRFQDVEGNVRPNWSYWYWLYGAGRNYAWDSHGKRFLFYIRGITFSYDPVSREWKDLAATGDPESTFQSQLLWGSICYDQANKQIVLFGGGNAQTERGDPGTWIYTPATNTWKQLKLDVQPPARANSPLVYDPVHKKVVLFGGDQLNELTADTWVFDGVKWEQKKPAISPTPRAGHAMLWLPKAQKILLLGGYGYTSSTEYVAPMTRSLPWEAWTYDVQENRWEFVQRVEAVKKPTVSTAPVSPEKQFLLAAVDDEDRIAVVDANRTFWTWNIGAFKPNRLDALLFADTPELFGVRPGTVDRRIGAYDPNWYKENIPAAEPDKVAIHLKNLPANKWVLQATPKRPQPNTDWGSAVYATDTDQIIRFSGGHSAYSGTAPHVYDTKTDRWSMPFAPEIPIDHCYGNDGTPGEWSFGGNPWMTGHTYKACGYDPNLKSMVFGPHKYSFFFNPNETHWTRSAKLNPYRGDFYTVTLITTPKGVVAWTVGSAFWRMDPTDKAWKPLEVKGKFPNPVCDNGGMVYDSKRNRMLAFLREGANGSSVHSYDLATGEAKPIEATGAAQVQASYRSVYGEKRAIHFREAVYLPASDIVMIGATGLFYDCAKNVWFQSVLPSDEPDLGKHPSYNLGVMYDPGRKLVWAVDTNCRIYVMRLDRSELKVKMFE